MGFRFRKSIGFKGFKINFSKKGVGYSYGFPGFRHTKTADGNERQTYTVPGTGISYVKSLGKNKRNSVEKLDKKIFKDKSVTGSVSFDEIMNYMKKASFITKENLMMKFGLTLDSVQNIIKTLQDKKILITDDDIVYKLNHNFETAVSREGDDQDKLYEDVLNFAIKRGNISASLIEKYYKLGHKRATKLIDILEENGIIGPQEGTKPRKVLVGDINEIHN